MPKISFPSAISLFLATFCLALLTAPIVSAATIKVEPGCTLSQAILSANRNTREGRCAIGGGEDTILLRRSVTLDAELPQIKSTVTIDGDGYSIFLRPWHRAFEIRNADVTLKDLKVRYRDRGRGKNKPAVNVVDSTLRIIDSSFSGCSAEFYVHESLGLMQGNGWVCGYQAEAVTSWFSGPPAGPEPPPPAAHPFTCESIPAATAVITARYGLRSGVQCNVVDAAGIGIQSVIDAGFISAIDIWGYVEQGVELCFPKAGKLTLLDGSVSPRAIAPLEAYGRGGMTCVSLSKPGTVVLSPGPAPAAQAPAMPESAAPESDECQATTTGHVKLRATASMGDNIIGYVRRGTTLGASAVTTYWIQVSHQGKMGWITARYVTTTGTCAGG